MPKCDQKRAHLIGERRECARSGEADDDEAAEDPSALPSLVTGTQKVCANLRSSQGRTVQRQTPRESMGGDHSETSTASTRGLCFGVCVLRSFQVVIMVAPVTTMMITVIMVTGAQPWSP